MSYREEVREITTIISDRIFNEIKDQVRATVFVQYLDDNTMKITLTKDELDVSWEVSDILTKAVVGFDWSRLAARVVRDWRRTIERYFFKPVGGHGEDEELLEFVRNNP